MIDEELGDRYLAQHRLTRLQVLKCSLAQGNPSAKKYHHPSADRDARADVASGFINEGVVNGVFILPGLARPDPPHP